MQSPSQSDPFWGKPAFLCVALVMVVTGVYFPAMTGTFIWDDDITLTNNPLVKLPLLEGLKHIWFSKHPTDYYPVTWSTFWLEWRLFGAHPAGYHAVNILLHALNTILLWRILLRLPLPGGPWAAWCAALLFALHPVCVDSVAWISQRKNTLSMVFYLGAILSYLRFDDGGGRIRYWTAVGAFLFALLSKSSIITLPLVLPCLLWFRYGEAYLKKLVPGVPLFTSVLILAIAAIFLLPVSPVFAVLLASGAGAIVFIKRRNAFENRLVKLLPFFILAAAAAFMTLWFQGKVLGYGLESGDNPIETIESALENSFSGGNNERNFGDRILVSGRVYWFYVAKVLFPARIAMVYEQWKVNPWHYAHYLPTLGMIAAIVVSFLLRKKIGRGLCAGLMYVAVALLPVLGFVAMSYQNYSWVANHLCYVAVPGVIALATGVAGLLITRIGSASRLIAPCAFVLVAGAFAFQSWTRSSLYRDPEHFWRDNIAKQPGAPGPWNELGIVLIAKNRLEEAAEAFRECINLKFQFVKPHNNLGTVLAYLNRYEEAAEAFKRALWVSKSDADALGNLGLVYLELGQPEKAAETLEETLRLRLMSPSTYHNLGLAYAKLNRMDEATTAFSRAIEMDPTNKTFQGVLGRHYHSLGNHAAALRHLSTSIELGTTDLDFFNIFAWILSTSDDASLRDGARALRIVADLEKRLDKPDLALLRTKAAALAESGRFDEAITVLDSLRALAEEKEAQPVIEHVDSAIRLYRMGQPFRDGRPAPSAP